MTESMKRNIAMVAYTEYMTDPRVKRAAESLAAAGYNIDIYVLSETGRPKYEELKKVNIIRLKEVQYRGKTNLAYIASYLRFFFTLLTLFMSSENRRKYKLIHIHNMPDFLVFTAIIPKLFGAKIILDIHDTMPELYKTKFRSILANIAFFILLIEEKFSAWFADRVFAVHIPQKNFIVTNHKIPEDKIMVITNFADKDILVPRKRDETESKDEIFRLFYHGTIANRFGLDIVLKGLKEVVKVHPAIKFSIYGKGDGERDLHSYIKLNGLQEIVSMHDSVPLEDIPSLANNADLGIVCYRNTDEATQLMLPLKLMEYISMEIPVLAVRNKAISYYFGENDLEYYESDNSESFAAKLILLIENPELLSKSVLKIKELNKKYNWETEKQKYLGVIREMINDES